MHVDLSFWLVVLLVFFTYALAQSLRLLPGPPKFKAFVFLWVGLVMSFYLFA